MLDSFEKSISGELGRELQHSPEVRRAVQKALSMLTPEERELIINKVTFGTPTTALLQQFQIGSKEGLRRLFDRTIEILRVYVSYFVTAPDTELYWKLPELMPIHGHLLMMIFRGQDRNCLIAETDYTGDQLDGMIERARTEALGTTNAEIFSLATTAIELWRYKRLGATPQKRDALRGRRRK